MTFIGANLGPTILCLICSQIAFATPDLAIMARNIRPNFISSGTPGLGPTGTGVHGPSVTDVHYPYPNGSIPHGSGCASDSRSVGTTSFIIPTSTGTTLATPIITPAVERRLIHTPSGGYSTSTTSNSTLLGPRGTGTGGVYATGTGATGTVYASGTVMMPSYVPTVVGRSKKAAWSWWG